MNKHRTRFVLGLFLAALAVSLPSADQGKKHPLDQWLDECMQKDPSTQGQRRCLDQAYQKWDQELNAVYQRLLRRLDAPGQKRLKESQRAWMLFRDHEFQLLNAVYEKLEGTMYLPLRVADRVDLVRKRTLELGSYLDLLNQK